MFIGREMVVCHFKSLVRFSKGSGTSNIGAQMMVNLKTLHLIESNMQTKNKRLGKEGCQTDTMDCLLYKTRVERLVLACQSWH